MFETVHVLASGSHATYDVHCQMASKEDAERAASELNAQDNFAGYFAQELPVMPAGRVPRRVTVYSVVVGRLMITGVPDGAEAAVRFHGTPRVNEVERWEWEWNGHPDVMKVELHEQTDGLQTADFSGLDEGQVMAAARAFIAEQRAGVRR